MFLYIKFNLLIRLHEIKQGHYIFRLISLTPIKAHQSRLVRILELQLLLLNPDLRYIK
jgi:hypothetical protein